MSVHQSYEQSVKDRIGKEKLAVAFAKAINDLFYERGIETVLFRNQLIDMRPSEILNLHNYARKFVGKNITIEDSTALLEEMLQLDLCPARFDIGRLTAEWIEEGSNYENRLAFIKAKMSDFIGSDGNHTTPKDVVLYGFGRIGRLVARELIAQEGRGEQLRLRAVVTRGNDDMEKRASLLRVDSVHGAFPGTVEADVDNNSLVINGRSIVFISANNPEDIDYTKYGINDALIIDNTGVFKDKEALSRHLSAKGASKVLLTAPGKGVPNIVHGVNQALYDPKEVDIFSAASCTTNAIVPVLKVIEDNLGVEKGHIETVHAYTNDQNLVDNMHKKYRRGRGAAINMVITETGAGQAASKALPSLDGKLTSNAIRVPVPDGSLAILNLTVGKETSIEEVNEIMRKAALHGDLVEQINFSISNELVSSDIVGNSAPSIFDSKATIVHPDGKNIVLYVWYDNEYGYSRQVIRLSKHIAQVRRKRYY
ncbi:MAG: glyceraldehyde-3-phosphate dehydrogenase [Bacteroidota bacterium]|nr:glyceraldehyde-3-phosphate dehydrogenase [Bacteroidota bacterium]MDX5404166.1 glyceraldehyde-3-phosphate dehydrogenase [Bacteroidota bacterium]MDX5429070.1 glyceraldehyde-3-phosphate dehydrogenase [Bacteroidota bacterium]MDX5447704.1 glyceraldehyde-3-phosphate dehydrogenase [Bacteroidota bacterium]MDX5506727.1 glyceraldehyde-3-phosphate dehydrogenase [Bacteroidota bacterium]